jgi:hypothetical protein
MSIELRLGCIGQNPSSIQFRLVVTNREPHRILLPYPEITGLEFADASGVTAQWYTCLLASSTWSGLVLDPEESKTATFSVRPDSVPLPQGGDHSDYYRWSVGLHPGRYTVRYSLLINPEYFDGDSHYRFPDVQKEAAKLGAVAWSGRAQSNAITIEHAPAAQ